MRTARITLLSCSFDLHKGTDIGFESAWIGMSYVRAGYFGIN
jgi:hypothetical protein